jgi:hypothetical protein
LQKTEDDFSRSDEKLRLFFLERDKTLQISYNDFFRSRLWLVHLYQGD